jgi:hypothetical protein
MVSWYFEHMFKEALLLGPIGDQSQTARKNSTEWLSHKEKHMWSMKTYI